MFKNILIKIEAWLNSKSHSARDAYLNNSQDIFELERRIRHVENNRF